ncbi:MAG: hypothetical protein V3V08_22410 [Nannocystaceae bacterium]
MTKKGESAGLGTGGPLLGLAKLVFLVAAYATTLALARLLPDPATLGRYNVVARLIAVPNMVIIQTLLFAVSRPMASQYNDGTPSYVPLRRRGMQMALVMGGVTCVVFTLGADVLATDVLRDAALAAPIGAVAPISLCYAFYAVNIGTLNATRHFSWQAALDILMAIMKASFIIAGAVLGLSLAQIIGGFTLAATLALCASALIVWHVRRRSVIREGSHVETPPMGEFAFSLLFFTAGTNLLLSVDLLILKRFTPEAMADVVGLYSSAQLVALVPYSLIAAVSLLMFPLIATLRASRDHERLRSYVLQTVKVTLLLLTLMASVASAASTEVQSLLFPAAYGDGARDLRLLVWGYSGYSFLVTTAWIFNSGSRTRAALGLVLFTLGVAGGLAVWWVRQQADLGAAHAVCVAGGLGVVASFVLLWSVLGVRCPWLHMAKLGAAVAAVEGIGQLWTAEGYAAILGKLSVLTFVFVVMLMWTRALTFRQLKDLRRAG